MKILGTILLIIIFISGCSEDPVPRPKAYFRIDLPEKEYNVVDIKCPFVIEIPTYSQFELRADKLESCWFNLNFPDNKAKIHFTYKPVEDDLRNLLEESHQLSYEHHVKANDIITSLVSNDSNCVYGLVYHLTGDVASPLQFYVTDSVNHFLRGSLYFNAHVNSDSLEPVVDFIARDVEYLVETLQWRQSACD